MADEDFQFEQEAQPVPHQTITRRQALKTGAAVATAADLGATSPPLRQLHPLLPEKLL